MPRQTPDPEPIPARMNGADLAAFVRKPRRTVTEILGAAGVSANNRDGYDVRECVPLIIAHRDEQVRKLDEEAASARKRKNDAEADIAQLDRARKTTEIVDECIAIWEDGRADIIKRISRLPGFTPAQIEEVFAAIRSVKLRTGEEE